MDPTSLFRRRLRPWKTPFQEFDLPVVIGFVLRHMKPFGVIVGSKLGVHRR